MDFICTAYHCILFLLYFATLRIYVVTALLHAQQHMNKLLLTRIAKQRVALLRRQ